MSKTPQEATPWPSAARGWFLVFLLALASVVSQFDRTVINLMVEPLKAEFHLNDTQFGALQGIAFGIFYILACIPIGRLADRYQRRIIIAVALVLWSLFAIGSGLARSYWQLFLTRIGVAAGEASLSPAAFSMLSDQFPPEKLGRPVSGFLMSAPIGQGLAFIGGGSLLTTLSTSDMLSHGPFAGFEPWQVAFIIIAAPGLLLVPIFLLIPEPLRRGTSGLEQLPLRAVIAVVHERRHAFTLMFAGFALVSLVSYAFAIWTPALLTRTYGLAPAEIGWGYGPLLIIFGMTGVYAAGWLNDHFSARGYRDAPLRVAIGGFAIAGVSGAIAPLMPTANGALTLLAPTIFFGNFPYPCAAAAIQLITPNRARAQVSALYITVTTLVGLAFGPIIIGAITDYLFSAPQDIRFSLTLIVGLATPLMAGLLILALPSYRKLRAD